MEEKEYQITRMNKKKQKNILCKCKKFGSYTKGLFCRICELLIKECICCNDPKCKALCHSPKSVPVPERTVSGDEERFIYFKPRTFFEVAVNKGDGSVEFPIKQELRWFSEEGTEFVLKETYLESWRKG